MNRTSFARALASEDPREMSKGCKGWFAPKFLGAEACNICGDKFFRDAVANSGETVFLFIHIPKSAGSSIECATKYEPIGKRWINMGHPKEKAVETCMKRCTINGKRPVKIVSVRDPYAFYVSEFCFAWDENPKHHLMLPQRVQRFAGFIKEIEQLPRFEPFEKGDMTPFAQTDAISWMCGDKRLCTYDFLLRTEFLQYDWDRLNTKYGFRKPEKKLPRENPTPARGRRGKCPETIFTREICDFIHERDRRMFTSEFNYTKRNCDKPFEITH